MDVILLTVELLSIIITAMLTLYVWWTRHLQGGVPFAHPVTMITMGYVISSLIQLNSA